MCSPSGLWNEHWAEDGGDQSAGGGAARPWPAASGEESNIKHFKVQSQQGVIELKKWSCFFLIHALSISI